MRLRTRATTSIHEFATLTDPEVLTIEHLALAAGQAGVRVDHTDVASLYVSLKHKPLLILAGPAGSGKCAFVRSFSRVLTGSNCLQRQIMLGHAWYLDSAPVNTTLVAMHSRLVTEKLLCMIDEASQPENQHKVFIVGLTHLSPAELLSFFTDLAFQIQHNTIMHIGDMHFSSPIAFPSNLLLMGTIDTTNFDWWSEDLLSKVTVINWHANLHIQTPPSKLTVGIPNSVFLCSRVRDKDDAYAKLYSISLGTEHPLQNIIVVQNILREHGCELSPACLDEVILFLANAWSFQMNGLFDSSTEKNLAIACDLILSQFILPSRIQVIRASSSLLTALRQVFESRMPRTKAGLQSYLNNFEKDFDIPS